MSSPWFNPASTLLRADTGTGEEKKVTVEDMLEDSDVVGIIKDSLSDNFAGIRLRVSAKVSAAGGITKTRGDLTVSCSRPATGNYKIVHDLGQSDFMVVANTTTTGAFYTHKIASIFKASTQLEIGIANDSSFNNWDFEFSIFEYL